MKKTALLLSLLILLSFSCDKKYKYYAFYIEKTVDVQFAAGSVGDFETLQNVDVYIDNVMKTHDTEVGLIEEITIEELSLKNADFDKFNSINMFISAEGVTETPLAQSDTTVVFRDSKALLNVSENKMDDYIKASTFSLKTTGQLSTSYSQAFTVPVYLRFLVKTYVK